MTLSCTQLPLLHLQAEELPYLLMKAGEQERLRAYITDLDVFYVLSDSKDGMYEVIGAWKYVRMTCNYWCLEL